MSAKKPAAVHVDSLQVTKGSGYPAPFDEPCKERARRVLGDLFDLTDFGVNIVQLAPGAWSSQRHWHSHEDEFVYILSGTPTLITDEGEQELSAGMCAGFKAGNGNGHQLVNKSQGPATYIEMGSRKADDDGHYPDIDLEILKRAKGGVFTQKNGTPYPE
ncbi:MAG: cupin domain-containing protein [Alphaproteobacteria bacterium]|nr:cupin domain-containing protein [Alphaproteobacteria bacterium]